MENYKEKLESIKELRGVKANLELEIHSLNQQVMRTTNSTEITKLMLEKNQKSIELQGVTMAIDNLLQELVNDSQEIVEIHQTNIATINQVARLKHLENKRDFYKKMKECLKIEQEIHQEAVSQMENTEYLELIRFLNAELGIFVGYNSLNATGDIAMYKQRVNHIFAEVEF
ncbi:MAG: hypothetical protein ACRCW7_03680 [Cetobacterium sp.]